MKSPFLLLSSKDNVLVAMRRVEAGTVIAVDDASITLNLEIPLAHKIAGRDIAEGEVIYKYGMPIGIATAAIALGEHVHVHNIRSAYTPTHSLQDADGREASDRAQAGTA